MKPKILVVEDEIIIAFDIKGILNDDYDVIIDIKTVEEAIAAIEQEHFDLVLLDINLKANKDGIQLGEYLLKRDTIPFVYITSNSDKITLDRVKETRPYGFIVKPFKVSDLQTTVYLALNAFAHRRIDNFRAEDEMSNDTPYRIKESINYINEHVTEKIEITKLAQLTKWKPHHFIRVFTKHMAVTPYQYILNRKIEKSKLLLLDDKISINTIAFEIGFMSYSNFCNAFKKITNSTPESYRNLEKLKKKRA